MANKYSDLFKGPQDISEATSLVEEFKVFAESLNSLGFVDARLVPTGTLPSVLSLVTSPPNRPNERQHLITFVARENEVEVVGPNPAVLKSAVDVESYLRRFGESAPFQNTLEIYRARELEPYVATLRGGDWNELTSKDVVVTIAKADHERIAMAEVGEQLSLTARLQEPPRLAKFRPGQKYAFLESSGFFIKIDRVAGEKNAPDLKIDGKRFEPGESGFLDL